MIINIKHKEDLITIDLSLKQIRYLKNYETEKREIVFIPLSNDDTIGYEYFIQGEKLNNNMFLKQFFECIKEDLKDYDIKIKIKDLEVLKVLKC